MLTNVFNENHLPASDAATALMTDFSHRKQSVASSQPDGPLVIAVPSKGRLQENTADFFAHAGIPFRQHGGSRDYRARIAGVENVEVLFLSASDIVTALANGTAHLGVTGEDLVREYIPNPGFVVEFMTPLRFGEANVIVAVPQAWIDVRTMADLDDVAGIMRARQGQRLRVATKYVNLTRQFFSDHGLTDYRIVESAGATEGAPAAGTAEVIVDITTTGATLVANNLKILDDGLILKSEAHLVASMKANWSPMARDAVRTVLSSMAAEEGARTFREVRGRTPLLDGSAVREIERRFDAKAPFGKDFSQGAATFICHKDKVFSIVEHLERLGATDILVSELVGLYSATNPLVEKLQSRIGDLR
jgi:ATP phosphoribosyltransferase